MNNPESRYLETCPVGCNAPLETTNYALPEGELLSCSECGQLLSQCSEARYWASMREFDDPQGTLPDAHSEARRFRRSKKFLDRIAMILKKPAPQISLLDVGCSSGAFLGTAMKLGYAAQGVEPAPQAATAAQAAGLKVRQGLLQEAGYADSQFDAVTLFEVIEHLKQPLELLRECHRILRPGGILLVGTGNSAGWSMAAMGAGWEYLQIDRHGGHVSFFTPASLARLAQQANFSVTAVRTRSVRFCNRNDCSKPIYSLLKLAGELVNPLAMLFGKGSDMAVYLRRD